MKRLSSLLVWLVFPALLFAQHNIDSLLRELDKSVDNYSVYSHQKDAKLIILKSSLENSSDDRRNYELYGQLYDEYNSYKSDSALKYARLELQLAEKLNDSYQINNSRLRLAFILAINSMFKESMDVLQGINKELDPRLKVRYFDICRSIYGNMADYAVGEEKHKYDVELKTISDSILVLNAPGSNSYVLAKTGQLLLQKQYDISLNLLFAYYQTIQSDIRKKANIAYSISYMYKQKGDRKREKYWLAISAINDIQSGNKEYISLRSLAFMLYEEGDIDRAYKYIKRSMEDALFCNARLRTFEISQMLPIIDKAYQLQTQKRQRQLLVSLVSISFLSLFLAIAIFFVYRQMRKLSVARKGLSEANEQLFAINSQLKNTNHVLLETNLIKEEYIGRYMDQCSVYIDKMDEYRRLLNKTAAAGKIDDLLKTIKSKQFIADELKEFYNSFDSTFLHLFPTFVKEFANLLVDDEYVQLKPGQLLNTELRIYALMRLGIDDGVKMSHFLRCSLSTIYNYRTKIRNKASGSREEFEEKVLRIGVSAE